MWDGLCSHWRKLRLIAVGLVMVTCSATLNGCAAVEVARGCRSLDSAKSTENEMIAIVQGAEGEVIRSSISDCDDNHRVTVLFTMPPSVRENWCANLRVSGQAVGWYMEDGVTDQRACLPLIKDEQTISSGRQYRQFFLIDQH